jgi:hypothetical protein
LRSHGFDGVATQRIQIRLHAAEVEKELPLSLRRRDFDDAPVTQDEFVHLGPDPVHGKGHQTHAALRIEALDRLHQPDIAFLNQVGLRQSIARVAARGRHHDPQMGHDQLPCRIEIVAVAKLAREILFLLWQQDRKTVDGLDIALQASRQGWDRQSKTRHCRTPFAANISSLVLRVLDRREVPLAGLWSEG